ncbi:cob(I)yrinic acid a,c-diamide adenosyltransferase [uncultured Endozoicomonas sp.]|uniref:cob(I)yrinic acid a,c-diamide adenosyltransferase n=1 Tax=uncultured Endozoicomonas sp. TaxID=432652 RepID=UPI00263566FF|nr:cob(I)yrinic acid a,c-diamide adenosyltransferase [uncultured Endozoicomonas sp.]
MSERKGYRLTRIYTRTGDKGMTRIGEGQQLPKSHPRIHAIGSVDEANSWLGMLIRSLQQGNEVNQKQLAAIQDIQHRMFDVGGELAMPGYQLIQEEHTKAIEALIDELNEPLPNLKNFTLPGGGQSACHCHMARTVSRRAERTIIELQESGEAVNEPLLKFVNRLSDLMYVLGRHCALQDEGEVLWQASAMTEQQP